MTKKTAADELAATHDPCGLSEARIRSAIGKRGATTREIADKLHVPQSALLAAIETMQAAGVLIQQFGERWSIEGAPAPCDRGREFAYTSRHDNTFLCGATGDNHLGSKYERLDVLNDLYDKFAAAGVDRVFNAGNWIDGECRLNRHEIHTYGIDGQCEYLADHYPQREGIVTYAVAGDDHEGWFAKDGKIDIGRHAEQLMVQRGRTDWKNLGYVESFVPLVNANTGKECQLLVQHPGGGSAYAVSYTVQKIVESFAGGEKPAALFAGHYHKAMFAPVRNVFTIQTGTTQDQSTFMRKKRIHADVGGWVVQFTQDPETGALSACRPEWFGYFNRGYYNGRWNTTGDVVLPDRGVVKEKPKACDRMAAAKKKAARTKAKGKR